jgi:hypothetical protein
MPAPPTNVEADVDPRLFSFDHRAARNTDIEFRSPPREVMNRNESTG